MSSGDINGVAALLAKTSVGEESGLLSFADRSLKLDNEIDAKEIVEAIKTFKNLKILELKGNTLGIKAAEALGEALKLHPSFERALWSDLFTGRLKTEIPDALRSLGCGIMAANARLVELDLSDNAFGPNGMTGLVDFLQSASCFTLKELRLNNNGLGIQGGKMLADSLLACYSSSVAAGTPLALRVFVSGRGRLEDDGATALAQAFKAMKSLEEVHMPQNGIRHGGITALAEAFKVNTRLRHINLSDNTFVEKGCRSMANAIPYLQNLEVLDLDYCLTGTHGAKAIANSLKEDHKRLRILKLNGNEISQDGAEAVIEAVINKDQLQSLELNENQLGDDGVEVARGMMESYGKLDQLGSLSDDEGEPDENDEKNEDEEKEEEEEEEEEEIITRASSKSNAANACVTPSISSQVKKNQVMTPEDFLQFPSPSKLQMICDDRIDALVHHLVDTSEDPEKAIQAFVKMSLLVTPLDTKTLQAANKCADAILSSLFEGADSTRTSRICNTLLVNLGLLKSEDKKFRPAGNLLGPLTVLEHVVRQSYVPKIVKDTLAVFVQKSVSLVDSCSDARKSLLQALTS